LIYEVLDVSFFQANAQLVRVHFVLAQRALRLLVQPPRDAVGVEVVVAALESELATTIPGSHGVRGKGVDP